MARGHAIRTKTIHFESFIIHEDDIGDQFSDVLATKAKEGVSVRLIYDWLGAFGKTSHRFWERLSKAGVHVRCFNPFRFDSPFGWLSRDHREEIDFGRWPDRICDWALRGSHVGRISGPRHRALA